MRKNKITGIKKSTILNSSRWKKKQGNEAEMRTSVADGKFREKEF